MDVWYKIERAKEELARVQVEAKRLLTYILQEEKNMRDCVRELLNAEHFLLAEQVKQQLEIFVDQNVVESSSDFRR